MSRLARAAALALCAAAAARAKLVTIHNDVPRLDVDGNIIDCHSGNIIAVNGLFYMVGEHYGNSSGMGPSPPVLFPKIVVYTSPDFEAWTFRGFAISDWPTKPYGTFYTPWVVFNKATSQFVMWFNAYLHGCCSGNWGVATSTDGIAYTLVSLDMVPTYTSADCNSIMVDDDGTAYNLYSSLDNDHKQSIDQLAPNYTAIVPGRDSGLFPDRYMEGGVLFKRGDIYYATAGSCCCFCRGGAGVVVYQAPSPRGPWVRQPLDVNCNRTDAGDICGAYGDRPSDPIRIKAQGIGLSLVPLADGSTAYLWQGERWLSGANNNPACEDACGCLDEPPGYIKGHDFSYWIPLEFDAQGNVLPFAEFVDSFTLDVAENFGVAHLNPRGGAAAAAAPALAPAPAPSPAPAPALLEVEAL